MAMPLSAPHWRRSWPHPAIPARRRSEAWLYRTFHAICPPQTSKPAPQNDGNIGFAGAKGLPRRASPEFTPLSRQGIVADQPRRFLDRSTAYLIDSEPADVDSLVAEALAEIERQTLAEVLIIEDEPIIAMDIEMIVRDLGHNVTGVGRDPVGSRRPGAQSPPSLVLADIQWPTIRLASMPSRTSLRNSACRLIFITAFPRALAYRYPTRRPTFLITKPFQRSTVKAAISTALFFDAATVAGCLSRASGEPDLPQQRWHSVTNLIH